MMREFEVAKRNLNPEVQTYFNTRIPASLHTCCSEQNDGKTIRYIIQNQDFLYHGRIKMIGDKMRIESDIIKDSLKFVTDQIVEHVDRILGNPLVESCSLILLVGGLSESLIVQKEMRDRFQTEERRVITPREAGLSVVKGAAIAGHALNIVTDRFVRYNYGLEKTIKYRWCKHPDKEKHKFVDSDGSVWVQNVFEVFMEKNTPVKEGTVITKKRSTPTFYENIYSSVYVSSRDVQFTDEEGCLELCTIHIYKDELEPYIGKPLDFQFNFTFGRTEIGIEVEVEQTKTKIFASVNI